jgi:carbon starvation protein
LWPLFGIANQMLAAIALMLCTVVVVKLKRERYMWVPGVPALWLIICTLTAGYEKLVGPTSFTAAANKYAQGVADGKLIAPATTAEEMQRIVTNNYVDMTLTGLFMLLVVAMALFVLRAIMRAIKVNRPTANEEPYVALSTVPQG